MTARALLGLGCALAGGCFAPAIEDGALLCPDQLCPPDFLCGTDGRCHREGDGASIQPDAAQPVDAAPADASDGCASPLCGTDHAECGLVPDRCGGLIQCGDCPRPMKCDDKNHCH